MARHFDQQLEDFIAIQRELVAQIEANPSHYRVWVATKSHPGELRGKLFAGMAHM